jgi:hypothetical protein
MDDDRPRFEFRVWGERSDGAASRIASLGVHEGALGGVETYLVSRTVAGVNPKIRDDVLDVKVLAGVSGALERWRVLLKTPFPVPTAVLGGVLGVPLSDLGRETFSAAALRDDVVGPNPDLAAIEVAKSRHRYAVAGCDAEVTEVTVAGGTVVTVALEAPDDDAVVAACRLLEMDGLENVSYPRFLRRMLGWERPDRAGGGDDGWDARSSASSW